MLPLQSHQVPPVLPLPLNPHLVQQVIFFVAFAHPLCIIYTLLLHYCVEMANAAACGIVRSTEIGSIFQFNKWRCLDNDTPKSDPCANQWQGLVCDEYTSNGKIIGLSLKQGGIRGSIPDNIFLMTSLQYLDLSGNQLTGTVPATIGSLQDLVYLNIGGNKLSGTIPTELGDLTSMRYMFAPNCNLTGTIPSQFGNMGMLSSLILSTNRLNGKLPVSLGNLKNVQILDASDNKLTGTIPMALGALSALKVLDISANKFTGTVPASMFGMNNLIVFFISGGIMGPYPAAVTDDLGTAVVSDDGMYKHLVYVPQY